MAIWYNAPGSEKNKNADFAKLSVADAKKIKFSEAVVKVTDEKVTVFAFVEEIEGELKNLNDSKWVFTPQLCMFELLVKGYEYSGKKVDPTEGMKIAIHAIAAMDGKPFKGWFDLSKGKWDSEIIIDGKNEGEACTPELIAMVSKGAFKIEECELVELAKVAIPDVQNYKGGRGGGGQKEADKLTDRLAFLKSQMAEGSDLRTLCESNGDPFQAIMSQLLTSLFG